jgi:hypothetical protein
MSLARPRMGGRPSTRQHTAPALAVRAPRRPVVCPAYPIRQADTDLHPVILSTERTVISRRSEFHAEVAAADGGDPDATPSSRGEQDIEFLQVPFHAARYGKHPHVR